jgi:hypothetical protein
MILFLRDYTLSVFLDVQDLLMRVGYLYFISIVEAADIVIDGYFGQVGECFVIVVDVDPVLDDEAVVHLAWITACLPRFSMYLGMLYSMFLMQLISKIMNLLMASRTANFLRV